MIHVIGIKTPDDMSHAEVVAAVVHAITEAGEDALECAKYNEHLDGEDFQVQVRRAEMYAKMEVCDAPMGRKDR